ncbi:kinetochore protein Spc24 isoform X3 [Manis pentadactyla]|uniref:kinetochore protein Spc24 isoform X3 n=1 Tax=Manis pentadactyla TaxID=143292 RepID=UPI00255CAC9F|nr:kinetochore protein Spc24 isoform X3 [Manis pentadactyla]
MAAFRDMEEVSQGLVSLLGANRAEAQQRRLLGRHEQIVERLLETQDGAEQQLREVLAAEEEVAQRLLDAKEQACLGGTELQQLEAQLQKAGEEDTRLLNPLTQLTRELEACKEVEADLETREREVDEDTTVTIPSAVPSRPPCRPAHPPGRQPALQKIHQRLSLELGGRGVVARDRVLRSAGIGHGWSVPQQ